MINKELYGWVDTGLGIDGKGGWTIEGGEEAYYEALSKEQLPTITKDIVIGDCENCIHRRETPESNICTHTVKDTYCGMRIYEELIYSGTLSKLIPPTTGCPQKPQTYIFNFVENTLTK